MSQHEAWAATHHTDAAGDPVAEADRVLLDRARLGLRFIMAGVAAVFIGWIVLHPGERPLLSIVQALNFAAAAVALRLMRDPSRRAFNHAVGFTALAITMVAAGAVGVIAGDGTTPVILMVALAVVSATLVPWDPRWQMLVVALVIATAIWTVATAVPAPRLFWLQNVGVIVPTLLSTVFISHALRRQRAAIARIEAERRSREDSLREANRRLELEIEEHRKTEAALRFAVRELDHRVKNTLAAVQAVADQTLRTSASVREFGDAFSGRIQAMARIHTALSGRRPEGLKLSELIELVVGPYRCHAESVALDCDGTFISPELVRVLGTALHELATNAAKHGALSTEQGRVAISSRAEGGAASRLRICWDERGGPRVETPAHRGFGTRLIEEALAYEFGGSVKLSFAPEGVRCEVEIPVPPA